MSFEIRPHGSLKIHDERGYTYIPSDVQVDLGITGKGSQVPYLRDANVCLLFRAGVPVGQILKGLDILRQEVELRGNGNNRSG